MNQRMEQIKEKITTYSRGEISLDIEAGKLGFCIFFFLLNDEAYRKQAEKLLDDVYRKLNDEHQFINLYQLSQVGTGIDYLIKNQYVKGNANYILSDVDNAIFRKLAFEDTIDYRMPGIIPLLHYLFVRLEKQKQGSDACFLWEELCIKTFNSIYISLESNFYNDPVLFSLETYPLPLFLYVIGKLHSLRFYNYRIDEVIKEMSGLIQSRLPVLHANRLYLLWGLSHLKKETGLNFWDEQIELLVHHIDYQTIIYKELRSKAVFVNDGVAGICLLLIDLEKTPYQIPFDIRLLRERIAKSAVWQEDQWEKESLGLFKGFSGLLLINHLIDKKENSL
jgi:hypothetical protein